MILRRRLFAAACAGAALAMTAPASAQESPNPHPRGEDLTIAVLTFGPGDHPFFKFGHDAIWIHDASSGEDGVYNYGMFSFDQPGVLLKFFAGRFRYWLGREGLGSLDDYREDNRSILGQELNLLPADKLALVAVLDENLRPENREYKYDYYRDNCATRVRDLVDRATHGRLEAASAGPGRLSFRGHTLRLTWDAPLENVLLDWLLGPSVDRPISRWEEEFLPGELAEALRRTRIAGPDGVERPLVKRETHLFDANRPKPPEVAPSFIGWIGSIGLALGAAAFALASRADRSRAARVVLGSMLSLVGLVAGFFGWVFLAGWAFTDHEVAYANENLFLAQPWALGLVVVGIAIARGSKWAPRAASVLLAASAGATLVGLVTKALPWFSQHNGRFFVLALPLWLGAAAGAWIYRRRSAPKLETGA